MPQSFPAVRPVSFRELRIRAGLSVQAAADRVGVTRETIYRWDRGIGRPKKLVIEALTQSPVPKEAGERWFRFIDLFAGIGAFRLAFESIGGECVFTSEWDKYCQQTYTRNFG